MSSTTLKLCIRWWLKGVCWLSLVLLLATSWSDGSIHSVLSLTTWYCFCGIRVSTHDVGWHKDFTAYFTACGGGLKLDGVLSTRVFNLNHPMLIFQVSILLSSLNFSFWRPVIKTESNTIKDIYIKITVCPYILRSIWVNVNSQCMSSLSSSLSSVM